MINRFGQSRSQGTPLTPKSVLLQPKRSALESYRKLHRYIGFGALLLLIFLALSGFLLNHPSLLGAQPEHTLSFAVDPLDEMHLFRGTRSGLYGSDNGGRSWVEVPMLFAAERAVDIAFSPQNPDHIYVVLEDLGLIHSSDGGIVWEQIALGFVPIARGIRLLSMGVGPNESLYVWTSGGLLTSQDGGKTWASVGGATQPGFDFYTLVHQIHTGYFFADWFVYVYDAAACGMVLLSISGVLIWGRLRSGKRRMH